MKNKRTNKNNWLHEGRSVRLTARNSACTTPHGFYCVTRVLELTEVVFANVTVLVHFEVNSNLLNVQRVDVRRIAWVGVWAILLCAFKLFSHVRDADRLG